MAKPKKITQNINKDAGLLDLPKVHVPHSLWDSKDSNYCSSNIGEIVPIYFDEVMPGEKRRVTMGMLSHMTTPMTAFFNAMYTELRAFFVPHRLSADLLAGYKTRKSPFVKVFGEDNASANASIIVPLQDQKLPSITTNVAAGIVDATLSSFGGIIDACDLETDISDRTAHIAYLKDANFLNLAAYELIYQSKYRNQNRESATESDLYKYLFDAYNKNSYVLFKDEFHKAQREKDYYTGSAPFTQKGDAVSAGLVGEAVLKVVNQNGITTGSDLTLEAGAEYSGDASRRKLDVTTEDVNPDTGLNITTSLVADLSSAKGVNIEQLRLMIKTQELLEKDMLYGSDMASSLNAHFGCAPMSLVLDEPLELKKVTITSQMQAIFQTSTTQNEQSILGTIGANATTQSGLFEIVPMTEFKEWGYIVICACHKAQNSYDSRIYKPKHIFKKARFDWYTPELDDLGYQPVERKTFDPASVILSQNEAVSFNEAWAEYRFKFNKVHGMFEPSRSGAYDFWTLAISNYSDIQSLYKQGVTELDRALSVKSATVPQFFDAYGFNEENSKPMKLRSIPGMDGVI